MLNAPPPLLSEHLAPFEDTGRTAPHNLEAEQALLGSIFIDNRALDRVPFLEPDHFFDPLHRDIFEALRSTIGANKVASPITLRSQFEAHPPIPDGLAVWQYLGSLAANATTIINAADYGRVIRDLATRRTLIVIGTDIVNDAYDAALHIPPTEQIEEAEKRLFQVAEKGAHIRDETTFAQAAAAAVVAANDAYRSGGMMRGLSTGFADLDAKLGGLQSSDLIILAGRPSMGKTALATNIAWNVARQGLAVDFRSLEMSAEQLATRIMAADIGVPSEKLRRGTCEEGDIGRLMEAERRLRDTPLIIDESGGLTIAQLAARCRRAKRKHDSALIVVDYLQLLQGTSRRRDGNRVNEVTEITVGLKALAKELQVPILALSQLNRAIEGRAEKRPQLSDLRESGSIEQDADIVLFVYREEYYVERARPAENDMESTLEWQKKMEVCAGKAEAVIAKQRHGPTGIVPLTFDGALTRFSNAARDYQEPRA